MRHLTPAMNTFLRSLFAFVVLFAASFANAQGGNKLKPSDVLMIELKAPAEDAQAFNGTYSVSERGTVKPPYIGEIAAAGLTTSELARRIEAAYKAADIYTNPTLTINVNTPTNYVPYVVNVGGEVRQPGEIPLREGMRLFQAITKAGGFTEFAKIKEIKLVRGNRETKYDMRRINPDGSNNPVLQDGDQVVVPQG